MNSPFDADYLKLRHIEWSRRTFLGKSAHALGALALGSLLNPKLFAADSQPAVDPHWMGMLPSLNFPPRAKRVIHLYMAGGPSHIDLLDPKPELRRIHGLPVRSPGSRPAAPAR